MSAEIFAFEMLLRDSAAATWNLFRAVSSSDIGRECLYVDDEEIGMLPSSREVSRKDCFPGLSISLFFPNFCSGTDSFKLHSFAISCTPVLLSEELSVTFFDMLVASILVSFILLDLKESLFTTLPNSEFFSDFLNILTAGGVLL